MKSRSHLSLPSMRRSEKYFLLIVYKMKTDTVLFIDSADKNTSSTSESDFGIDLSHSMLFQHGTNLMVHSLHCPNTLKTINTGVNNVLHTKLGIVQKNVQLNTSKTYDTSTLSTFATDLQDALNTVYPTTPSLQNAATTWYFGNWSTDSYQDMVFTSSGANVFTSGGITITFTQYDVNNGTCVFTTSAGSTHTWSYNSATGHFESLDYTPTQHHCKTPLQFRVAGNTSRHSPCVFFHGHQPIKWHGNNNTNPKQCRVQDIH